MPPEVKALLRETGIDAVRRIVALMDSEDERIALAAAMNIADRAFGKPTQVIAGDPEQPITVNVDDTRERVLGRLASVAARLEAGGGAGGLQ